MESHRSDTEKQALERPLAPTAARLMPFLGKSSLSGILFSLHFFPLQDFTKVISLPLLIQNDAGKILPDT